MTGDNECLKTASIRHDTRLLMVRAYEYQY